MANVTPLGRRRLLWAGEVLRLLAGFGVVSLLVRTVSTDTLGNYLAIVAVVMVLPRFLDSGLPHAMAYFLRARAELGRSALRVLVRHALACALLACGICWLLRFIPFDNPTVHNIVVRTWLLIAALVASETAALLALSTLIPRNRYVGHVISTLSPPLLMLSSATTCLVLGWQPSIDQLLTLLLGASLCGATFAWISAVSAWPSDGSVEGMPAWELYRYGLRSYGTSVTKVAAQRFDRLYLATAMGASSYALYSLAVSIRDLALFPANLHALTLRNHQIDLQARQLDVWSARRLLLRVSLFWMAAGFAISLLTWPHWSTILRFLFGHPPSATAMLMSVLALSIGPMAVLGFSYNHLYALERPERVTILNIIGVALLFPLFALVISFVGLGLGAAIAAVAWSSITAVVSLVWALTSEPKGGLDQDRTGA